MKFFRTIKDSVYQPGFYQEIATSGGLASAWGYYTKLAIVAILVVTLVISVFMVPALNRFLGSLRGEVLEVYPDELALTFENGTVSSNVVEPYVIDMPSSWKSGLSDRERSKMAHLVVIDTANGFTPELFESYQAGMWIMRDRVAFQDDNGYRIQNFSDIKYENGVFVFDESKIVSLFDAGEPFLRFVPALVVALLFFGLVLLYGWSVLYVAFSALFTLLLGKILKKGWTYRQSLTLSFYAATLPFILYHISLPFSLAFGPMTFMVLLLLVLIVNFGWDKKIQKNEVSAPLEAQNDAPVREGVLEEHKEEPRP